MFFAGNERRLLIEGARGRVNLILAEDVVEEVLRVMEERFASRPSFAEALEWFTRLVRQFELVPRTRYKAEIIRLERLVRDPTDAPVLACASISRVDALVSGDKDVLILGKVGTVRIRRTREILTELRTSR